ncbi:hypothetical protein [Streptomyces clavuligerus]|uniref:hypothetical protein n=1 Tax=Streptomyces clavuligerus TaxID=1901 RepID=UPI0001851DB4|nr:hypothetical protein [Streptomyces clavuligerus]MBY6307609.1 hypothetical protein [Streptomyces clavuligerus]WDN56544.1 hypothetical protein LL058_32465 [Streptomyces clavuligerus]
MPQAGTTHQNPLSRQVEIGQEQTADIGAVQRVDANQNNDEAVERGARVTEKTGEPAGGDGRRHRGDPREDEPAGGATEDK